MNTRLRAAVLRAGVAAALAAGVVGVGAGPAYAADGPDIAVTPISLHIAKGVKQAKAKPFQVELDNLGNADASDVEVEVDLRELDGVGFVRPDGCEKAGKAIYTCAIGDIPAGKDVVIGIPLFSVGAVVGNAGSFKVTATAEGDTNVENNVNIADITVEKRTYDLTVWAQDVYAEVVADGDEAGEDTRTPVPAGGTAPFDSAIFNHGSKRVVGVSYSLKLPAGVSVVSAPDGCVPADVAGYALFCEDDEVVLKPGEVLLPQITVKVAEDTPAGVLTGGVIRADALEPGADDAEQGDDEARMATQAQRRDLVDADDVDNTANFDVFVGAAPTGEPTTPPGEPTTPPNQPGGGGGDGGGLPVTGPQTALIAGVGAALLAAGVVLLLALRRRRRFTVE